MAQNKKKNTKQPPFNSCGRRGEPPVFLSSANYGTAFLPGAGQAPPPQPPLKKEEEGLTIIIIIIFMITTAPARKQKGKELITSPATIITAIFITIIATPALLLRGEPPISQRL